MELKPIGDRMIVKVVEVEETTASGLIIPDAAKDAPTEGCRSRRKDRRNRCWRPCDLLPERRATNQRLRRVALDGSCSHCRSSSGLMNFGWIFLVMILIGSIYSAKGRK